MPDESNLRMFIGEIRSDTKSTINFQQCSEEEVANTISNVTNPGEVSQERRLK